MNFGISTSAPVDAIKRFLDEKVEQLSSGKAYDKTLFLSLTWKYEGDEEINNCADATKVLVTISLMN